jgi:(p)ppGpp synthase/HD superfamily hydrolase
LIHDTIKDTELTLDYFLTQGFPQEIVDVVLSVTRKINKNYDDFTTRAS